MPGMPRIKGKLTQIAYKILGTPVNLQSTPSGKEKKIDRRSQYIDTRKVR